MLLRRSRLFLVVFSLVWVSSCIPAEIPAQLEFTPGPEFQISHTVYENQTFVVTYPSDWRVISPPTEFAGQVTLVAPQDNALIFITANEVHEVPIIADLDNPITSYIGFEDDSLHTYLTTDEASLEAYQSVFAQVVDSIKLK